MTFQEYAILMKRRYEVMVRNLPDKLQLFAVDTRTQIQTRVENTGKNSDGGYFTPYSTNPAYIAVSYPGVKKLNPQGKPNEQGERSNTFKSGEKKGQKHKTRYFANGYDQYKTELGRNDGFKNFSLSGKMWAGFNVKNTRAILDLGAATELGGINADSQDKIDANSDREGRSIIEMNTEEKKYLDERVQKYVYESFK